MEGMRAVIRSRKTGLYYQIDEQWAPAPARACDFASKGLAKSFAAHQGLHNVEVLCYESGKPKHSASAKAVTH